MRAVQIFFGLLILLIGLLLLALTLGVIALTLLDLAGIAFIFSGVVFWIPGLAWRTHAPWLTALFIPGSFAFAMGGILVYTARVGGAAWFYLWALLVVAVGFSFLAMYYLGPHARWLQILGWLSGGSGVLIFGIALAAWSPEPAARIIGPLVLIVLGLVFAVGALMPQRTT